MLTRDTTTSAITTTLTGLYRENGIPPILNRRVYQQHAWCFARCCSWFEDAVTGSVSIRIEFW